MIEAAGAALVYQDQGSDVFACRNITLDIQPGEFLGILGPSGSGKSSLLYLLSGLKLATHGQVSYMQRAYRALNDEARAKLRLTEFGFVFQQPYLLGYLTAAENVAVAFGRRANIDWDQVNALLESLGIASKSHRMPHELSGGERQRVCVARALVGKPKAIFADEPTASLDHTNGAAVVDLLNRHRGDGALIMVTHDASMLEYADRIVRIEDGLLLG